MNKPSTGDTPSTAPFESVSAYYPQNLLVNWNPPDGVYQLTVETGAGTPGNVTQTGISSPPIQVVVDSSGPTVHFTATGWKYAASTGGFSPFSAVDGCLVIERDGADIEIELSYGVTASHLYSVCLVPDGCGVGDVTVTDSGALAAGAAGCGGGLGYLYDGPTDNSLSGTVTYTIAGDAPDGCYSWTLPTWAALPGTTTRRRSTATRSSRSRSSPSRNQQ